MSDSDYSIEIHYDGSLGFEALYYDDSDEALIDIVEHLRKKQQIVFISFDARACVDFLKDEVYFA